MFLLAITPGIYRIIPLGISSEIDIEIASEIIQEIYPGTILEGCIEITYGIALGIPVRFHPPIPVTIPVGVHPPILFQIFPQKLHPKFRQGFL